MWRPDDIVRHPACSHLIGTSQTVEPARNFDIRRNYRTNKSLKSKHGSGPAVAGGRSGRGIKPPPAALTASSSPNNQRWESVGLQAIAASRHGDEREERSGARSRQLSQMSVHCTCVPGGGVSHVIP